MPSENKEPSSTQTMLQTLRWVWQIMLLRPCSLALISLLFTIQVTAAIMTPHLIRNFLASFEGSFDPTASYTAAVWMVGVGWVAFYSFQFLGYTANAFYQTFGMAEIFRRLYDRVQYAPHYWHVSELMGATIAKITRCVNGYEIFTDRLYLPSGLIAAILVSAGATLMLAQQYPVIAACISISLFTGGIILLWLTVRFSIPAYRRANHKESQLVGALADRIIGNHAVKSFASEGREKESLTGIIKKWRVLEYKSWSKSHIAGLIYEVFLVIAISCGAYFCINYVQAGVMPLSDVAMVFFTISMINGYMRQLGRIIRDIQKALSDIEDGAAIGRLQPESTGHIKLSGFKKRILIQGVRFSYPEKENNVTVNIDHLQISNGQKVGLIGPSGAGKSTLVSLLTRFYDPTSGDIMIDGQTLRDTNVQNLRDHIAVIPQDTALFHRSLHDNIGYGRPDASEEEVIDAAKRANAHDFISALPQGYQTLVGERGVKLSGGQRQRIAIARAILKDAPILILDEATSALDSVSEKLIQESLKNLMKDKTVIAIAHRLSTIAHLDRLIVMDEGQVIGDGPHTELLQNNTLYAKLWNMQSGGFLGE